MSRHPLPDSLATGLEKFFTDNPNEELTYADIAIKFDVPESSVATTIGRMRKQGRVKTTCVSVVRSARVAVPGNSDQPSRAAVDARQTEEATTP